VGGGGVGVVRMGSGGKEVRNFLIMQAQAHPQLPLLCVLTCQLAPTHPSGCNTFFLSTPTILPNSPSLSSPYHLSIRVPRVILPSQIRRQCRLLRLAIGNFLSRKVTCPAISNVARAECPDDPRPVIEQAMHARTQMRKATLSTYLVVEKIVRSKMKHSCAATECDAFGPSKKPKCRAKSTFPKWQAQLEREHKTKTWLRCETDKSNPTACR